MRNLIEIYEDFYFDNLSENQRNEFKLEMNSDVEIKDEYRHFSALMQALEHDIAHDLKEQMSIWEKEYNARHSTRVIPLIRKIAVAASILLMISLVAINILYSDSFIARSNSAEFVQSPIRSIDGVDIKYYQVYNAYEKGNYIGVIDMVDEMREPAQYYGQALLLQAKSYHNLHKNNLAGQKYTDAITYFKSHDLGVAKETADYQYLLFLLKSEGTSGRFKTLLHSITENKSHLYHDNALNLSKDIKSFWRNFVIF